MGGDGIRASPRRLRVERARLLPALRPVASGAAAGRRRRVAPPPPLAWPPLTESSASARRSAVGCGFGGRRRVAVMAADGAVGDGELEAKAVAIHRRLCAVYRCPIPYFH